jgi:protein TonB
MSINLIESGHRTQKSVRSTFVSVTVHACIITLAAYASARAGEVIVKVPIDTVTVFYAQQPKAPADPGKAAPHAPEKGAPKFPPAPNKYVFNPSSIRDSLPPIDSLSSTIGDSTLFDAPTGNNARAPGGGVAGDGGNAGEPLFAAQVEKPAMPRNGNPSPKYPSLLESSRIEGAVLVQFIVDTLGVADMRSFKVLDATNDLFAESTRATLSTWRFFPAEAGGHKVRQIVQLPLKFVAPHR